MPLICATDAGKTLKPALACIFAALSAMFSHACCGVWDSVEQSEHRRAVLASSLVPQAPRAGKRLMLTVIGLSM